MEHWIEVIGVPLGLLLVAWVGRELLGVRRGVDVLRVTVSGEDGCSGIAGEVQSLREEVRDLAEVRGDVRELVVKATTTEREVRALRKAKHSLANAVHSILGKLEMFGLRFDHLERRVDALDGGGVFVHRRRDDPSPHVPAVPTEGE